ncbi:hypothetical protein [Desulfogranum japonicum]|uniref:hypothetical protein n=1 Tax=Desulfogranum japonicum TaxID=231447 RepID=UPI00048AACE3|nr:hypothetical protein [Desulfogranum japonicum]
MTGLIARIVFLYFYLMMYGLPLILLFILDENLGIDIFLYFPYGEFVESVVLIFLLGIMLILPAYRSKLASEAYGERNMKFWQAHTVSGAILKANLSFLPIIGFLFDSKNDK